MPQNILIVDDEPLLQRILAEEFQDAGYDVRTASGGEEAFQLLEQHAIDLIISDMKMPGMSGIDLLQKIQRDLAQPPPMILVSAFSETTVQEAYAEGAHGVFTKPIDYDALARTVRRRLLPTREQFRTEEPLPPGAIAVRLHKPELDTAFSTGCFSLGRGGFFILMQEQFPRTGDGIAFRISFGEGVQVLEGHGIVRWVRSHPEPNVKTGIGIEFLHLTPASLDAFEKAIQSIPKAFIPLT